MMGPWSQRIARCGVMAVLWMSSGCEAPSAPTLPCDVQRVLSRNCLGCHDDPLRFGAPLSLSSYADLHGTDGDVLERVKVRIESEAQPMPPPPNAMPDEDRELLLGWIEQQGPAAKGAEACESGQMDAGVAPVYTRAGEPPEDCEDFHEFRAHGEKKDSRLSLAEAPGVTDRYMCFYFDVPWGGDAKAQWLHSLVDNSEVLHHWILYGTDSLPHPSGSVRPCSAVQAGSYFIAGWAPGGGDFVLPSNVEMDLPTGEGAGLILEVHYYTPEGEAARDRSGVRVCTAPEGTRENLAGVTFTGSEGICLAPQSRGEAAGVCDPPDDAGDIHILGAWPHMHRLGAHMKITVERKNGRDEVLLDEPFDFASQLYYPFAQGQWVLHPGDRLRTECMFRNDTDVRVPFGERTQDEMCYGFITSWPAGALQNDPSDVLQVVGGAFQQERRCMNPLSILESCGGLSDFPEVTE